MTTNAVKAASTPPGLGSLLMGLSSIPNADPTVPTEAPDAEAIRLLDAAFSDADPSGVHILSRAAGDNRNWTGGRRGAGYQLAPGHNWYVSLAQFRSETGERKDANVETHRLLVLDDVGTATGSKVNPDKVQPLIDAGFTPLSIVETSPGNHQYLFRLAQPLPAGLENDRRLARVRRALAAAGLTDKGAATAVHWVRLPGGINDKPKYRRDDGSYPVVRMVGFNPGASVDLDRLEAYLATMAPVSRAAVATAPEENTPAGPDKAPDLDLLRAVVAALPVDPLAGDYDTWLVVGLAVWGATSGTSMASEGRALFIEWSEAHELRGDAEAAAAKWDSHRSSHVGFRFLLELVRRHNPAAFRALQSEHARLLFTQSPLSVDDLEQLNAIERRSPTPPPEWVKKLNAAGWAYIAQVDRVWKLDPVTGATLETLTPNAFRTYFGSDLVPSGPGGKLQPLGKAWLEHPDAARFVGAGVWALGGEPPGYLNTFRGFPTQSALVASSGAVVPTDVLKPTLDFLQDVIASGRQPVFEYVLHWLAWKVQNPTSAPGTVLALIGGQGTGKSTLADLTADLIGRRFAFFASSERQMIGQFNAQIVGKLFLVLEEAFLGSDPRITGPYKDLVTGADLKIEAKGVDLKAHPNTLAIMVTSNHLRAVPLEPGDRRSTVIEVSDVRKRDNAYFRDLRDCWALGGREAFLQYLLALDLSQFDPRTALDTDEKMAATAATADIKTRFVLDLLDRGISPSADPKTGHLPDWTSGPVFINSSDLYDAFVLFARGAGAGSHLPSRDELVRHVGTLIPGRVEQKPRAGGARLRGFQYPPLDDCAVQVRAALRGEKLARAAVNSGPLVVQAGPQVQGRGCAVTALADQHGPLADQPKWLG